MTDDSAMLARAGDYVLGLMDEDERRTAERDLETDPAFRDAVARFASQMHKLDRTAASEPLPTTSSASSVSRARASLMGTISEALNGILQYSLKISLISV